jgi:hypothetical protein
MEALSSTSSDPGIAQNSLRGPTKKSRKGLPRPRWRPIHWSLPAKLRRQGSCRMGIAGGPGQDFAHNLGAQYQAVFAVAHGVHRQLVWEEVRMRLGQGFLERLQCVGGGLASLPSLFSLSRSAHDAPPSSSWSTSSTASGPTATWTSGAPWALERTARRWASSQALRSIAAPFCHTAHRSSLFG